MRTTLALALLLGLTAVASAQNAPMPPPPPPGAPQAPLAEGGIVEDANSGRTWFAPTALTAPRGTWTFSDYELLLVGGSYSPTDDITISAATLLPIVSDMPFWGLLSAKARVIHAGKLHVAAQGSVTLVADRSSSDDYSFWAGSLGGVATYCIDAECHSHVSGYLAGGFADSDQSSVPFLLAGSGVFRVARRIKLVFEIDTAFILGDINDTSDGFLGWYGARFTSSSIGVDLGFIKPFSSDGGVDSGGLVMGFPFVSFTYRGLPGDY